MPHLEVEGNVPCNTSMAAVVFEMLFCADALQWLETGQLLMGLVGPCSRFFWLCRE